MQYRLHVSLFPCVHTYKMASSLCVTDAEKIFTVGYNNHS